MKKALLQFVTLAIIFFGTWLLLAQVPFVRYLSVTRFNKLTEKKLGDYIMKDIRKTSREINTDSVQRVLDTLKNRICIPNGIRPSSIYIHLMENDQVNALALPGNNMVIYTGLLKYCDSSSELCGVIAHEIGHMEYHHIMKRMMENISLTAILSISGGSSAPGIIKRIAAALSSTAFDRKQESEADAAAVRYLNKAGIDPAGLANLLTRFAGNKMKTPKQIDWLSTHPDSGERAARISTLRSTADIAYTSAVSQQSWEVLKNTAQ